MKYQLYIVGMNGPAWVTLCRLLELPDGRVVKTKLLRPDLLQCVRRTGEVEFSDQPYTGGEPQPGQWRVHPDFTATNTAFRRSPQSV